MDVEGVWRLVDECECGDYRFQHGQGEQQNGNHRGQCTICSPQDMMNQSDCLRFRFAYHHHAAPEFAPRPRRAR